MAVTGTITAEVVVVSWVPTLTSTTAPTATQLNAGTVLSCDYRDASGWSTKTNFVDDPRGCSRLVGKVPGMRNIEDSSITFATAKGGLAAANPLISTLAIGTSGFIVVGYSGVSTAWTPPATPVYAAGDKVNVFTVTVANHIFPIGKPEDLISWTCDFGVSAAALESTVA